MVRAAVVLRAAVVRRRAWDCRRPASPTRRDTEPEIIGNGRQTLADRDRCCCVCVDWVGPLELTLSVRALSAT